MDSSPAYTKAFKAKIASSNEISGQCKKRCIFLEDNEISPLKNAVDGIIISSGGLHFLAPNDQRAFLLHSGTLSQKILIHCIVAKNQEASWYTYYHEGGDSDNAYRIAPLTMYKEVGDMLHRKISIFELPEESGQSLYRDVYILIA